MPSPAKIDISSRTIIFTVLFTTGFILSLFIIWQFRSLLYSLFLAFILMSGLRPLVMKLERRKVGHILAVTIVFFTTIISFVLMIALIVPPLVQQTFDFITNFPRLVASVSPFLAFYVSPESVQSLLPQLTNNIPQITTNFFKLAGDVMANLLFIISTLFFTFYFLLDRQFGFGMFEKLFAKDQARIIQHIFLKIEKRMSAWMWGQLLLMVIIGTMTFVGLVLFDVQYALPLAFFAGLLEAVPIIGPIFSAIPAFFVVASRSFFQGGGILLMYLIIQQLENNVIVPYVMRRTVGLHPVVTLIAITIGGKLGGVVGVLISVPIALFIETVILEIRVLKKL